jgi:hypothetical protein
MTSLLQSKFETYLLDEENDERLEGVNEFNHNEQDRAIYPEGFFSEL